MGTVTSRVRNVLWRATVASTLLSCSSIVGSAPGWAQTNSAEPTAQVTGGTVRGRSLGAAGGAVFKGIPYAAAPVGDLRWRAPSPVKTWSGVRPAQDYGAACMQTNNGWNKLAAEHGSEDCLFLNVWTPDWPAKARRPVMVWIHGGANMGGSAMGAGGIEPPFDGESLARHGVVLVTINYRLGLFSFLGHPELTAESPHHASGNYGILDQVAALRWVHDNIARFGGDPANVTVFGQSAGGQDVSLLVATPLTRGLIQKAIVESGSPMIGDRRLQTPAQTAQLGTILAQSLSAPATGSIAYLRSLPADQILAAWPDFRKRMTDAKLGIDVAWDGYAVPEYTPQVYWEGREARLPLIVGTMAQDSPGYRPVASPTPDTVLAAALQRVEAVYGAYPDLKAKAAAFYRQDGGGANDPIYGQLDLRAAVDHDFRCQGTVVARWHGKVAPTYHYEFTAGTPEHRPQHSGELDFVFGYLRDQAAVPKLAKLSDQIQTYWTNFAKTGNPNGGGLPRWSVYGAKRAYVEFGNAGPIAKTDLRGGICGLYADKLDRDLRAMGTAR